MRKPVKTVVVRVPIELKQYAKDWQRALGSSKEIDGWNQIKKIYSIKNKKMYPQELFRL